jgi:hypothetical protein
MSQYSRGNSRIITVRPSEIQPGDIVLGPAPTDQSLDAWLQSREIDLPLIRLPSRPELARRASSLDRRDFPAPYRNDGAELNRTRHRRRRRTNRREQEDSQDQDDSEDSIPPQSRRRRGEGRNYARSQSHYDSEGSIPPRQRRSASARHREDKGERKLRKDADATSSSDLGCTDDDKKTKKKAQWKKWAAIGLAGVATIHAVHGVHETVEKTQHRRKELAEGKISQEEAKKKKTQGRWKTAADVGIAAVWLKSAYDEIQEYREVRHEYAEVVEKGEERHKRRLERAKSARGLNGQNRGRNDDDDD